MEDKLNASEYLLKACLSNDRSKINDYSKRWEAITDPNDVDFVSMRLIPFFYDHLKKYNLEIPFQGRLNVIYKYWWLKHKLLQDIKDKITENFRKNQIQFMLLKGAVVSKMYEKPLHRTMSDLDLIVAENQLSKAKGILKEMRFTSLKKAERFYALYPKTMSILEHAFTMSSANSEIEVDLHWKIGTFLPKDFTSELWNTACPKCTYEREVELEIIFILNTLNGYFSEQTHLNWILDCKVFVDSKTLDWSRINELINHYKLNSIWYSIRNRLLEFSIHIPKTDIIDYYNPKNTWIEWKQTKGFFNRLQNIHELCNSLFLANNKEWDIDKYQTFRFYFYKYTLINTILGVYYKNKRV